MQRSLPRIALFSLSLFLTLILAAIPGITDDGIHPEKCSFKGIQLYGKVKVVEHFPDIQVQVVESFPDLKVKWVKHFPDVCGKWKQVDHFADFKIQYVNSFPDIKIKLVDSFPGMDS
ncbi:MULTISPECIES: hypothetical protein [unclassified Roseofilum]|uniref:hypothetical protein n=1 Tax=unclassified Roseofilum TaxID=2620099 RepID=UPI000E8B27B6|nr:MULTISPECIES: hypothetical protein [unclassified Roseofilum]MBP0009606.1 hypothetical protein [Roseofilum sp. Belize Diploria]MBP0033338.1 hypothetical protein [Roseofilum sp. Belize BBD 4]HBR00477.1 hypothetical protein [Cyanobacteria bacterium UBA11691]